MQNVEMIEASIAQIIENGYKRIAQLEKILGCKERKCVLCNGIDCPAIKNKG